mgnify:CR=1 FL=1
MPPYPRFIVDAMLGHVARWLRLLGYDTLYSRSYEDWKILKVAEEEDRIVVTRDLGLFRRARKKGLRAMYVEEPAVEKVLALLSSKYGIRLHFDKNDTRCPVCNGVLRYTTSLVEVAGKVNEAIAVRYKEFWICTKCGKVYWQGRHWRNINQILESARIEKTKLEARGRRSRGADIGGGGGAKGAEQ